MIHIQVDVGNSLNRLLQVEQGLQQSTRLYTALGETLRTIHKKRFEQEQRTPDGQAWQPLSVKYASRKKKGRGKILIREGYLKNTLRFNASEQQVEFGSDRVYARIHHFGGRHIPARAWLGLNDNNRELLLQKTEHYLQSLLRG